MIETFIVVLIVTTAATIIGCKFYKTLSGKGGGCSCGCGGSKNKNTSCCNGGCE